ncbi:MAG: hypothetical protein V7K63_08620, partial [Nostoc sp.]
PWKINQARNTDFSLGLNLGRDQEYFRCVCPGDMTVLRESPWYQEILREGQARGEAEGEVRGIISSIETSLEAKFGSDGLELMSQISQISDLEQLKEILRRIVVANTIQELRNVL